MVIYQAYWIEHRSINWLALEHGVEQGEMFAFFTANGIRWRRRAAAFELIWLDRAHEHGFDSVDDLLMSDAPYKVAEMCGVTPNTVYWQKKKRGLPVMPHGGCRSGDFFQLPAPSAGAQPSHGTSGGQ